MPMACSMKTSSGCGVEPTIRTRLDSSSITNRCRYYAGRWTDTPWLLRSDKGFKEERSHDHHDPYVCVSCTDTVVAGVRIGRTVVEAGFLDRAGPASAASSNPRGRG